MTTFKQNENFEDPVSLCPPGGGHSESPAVMAYFGGNVTVYGNGETYAPPEATEDEFLYWEYMSEHENDYMYGEGSDALGGARFDRPSDGGYPHPDYRCSEVYLRNIRGAEDCFIPIMVATRDFIQGDGVRMDEPFAATSGLGLILDAETEVDYSYKQIGPGLLLLNITNSPAQENSINITVTYQGKPINNVFALRISINNVW